MSHILDELDVIKNIEGMYESNTAFNVLKDFEKVLDTLDLYVYENWEGGELAEGPKMSRHWVTAKFFWPKEKMPDPMGGKRLLDYDCKVNYTPANLVKPRKVIDPDDLRPGTKKGKLDRTPIWIVEITMPKKLLADMFANGLDDLDIQEIENQPTENNSAPAPEAPQDQETAPEAPEGTV